MNDDRPRVTFRVDDDEQATKLTALLDALGYEPVRETDSRSDLAMSAACDRIAKRCGLTDRERAALALVVRGNVDNAREELGISRSTFKWHMHNIFAKTETGSHFDLLVLVLDEVAK